MNLKYVIILLLFSITIHAQECKPIDVSKISDDPIEIQSLLQNSMEECPSLATAIKLAQSFVDVGDHEIAQEVMLDALIEVVDTDLQKMQWLTGSFDLALDANDICQANQYLNELSMIEGEEETYNTSRKKLYSKIKDQVLSSQTIGCAMAQNRSVAYRGMKVKPKMDLSIHFDFNSDKLTASGIAQSQQLGNALSSNKNKLLLIGHTDSIGTEDYNMKLSMRRSKAVKQYIVNMNANLASQVTTQGKGETQLLSDGQNDDDHKLNRRVEIQLQ